MRIALPFACLALTVATTAPAQLHLSEKPEADLGIDALLDYVLPMVLHAQTEARRTSALLARPQALDGVRTACERLEPAVLFDLDPQDGLFVLDASEKADAQLVQALEYLRFNRIQIAWISDHSMARAQEVRTMLAASGLDPNGSDLLLLQSINGQRKQERRKTLAKSYCVLAIAGDTYADFDELFDYLKEPADARELAPIMGKGWFLLPSPILQSA